MFQSSQSLSNNQTEYVSRDPLLFTRFFDVGTPDSDAIALSRKIFASETA